MNDQRFERREQNLSKLAGCCEKRKRVVARRVRPWSDLRSKKKLNSETRLVCREHKSSFRVPNLGDSVNISKIFNGLPAARHAPPFFLLSPFFQARRENAQPKWARPPRRRRRRLTLTESRDKKVLLKQHKRVIDQLKKHLRPSYVALLSHDYVTCSTSFRIFIGVTFARCCC